MHGIGCISYSDVWGKWPFLWSLCWFTWFMWGYGASHTHCTSRLGLGLWVRYSDVFDEMDYKHEMLTMDLYDITYGYVFLWYGLVYVLGMCMKAFKVNLAFL